MQKLDYRFPAAIIKRGEIIPWQYLRRKMRKCPAFQNDRRGINVAIKSIMVELAESNILIPLDIGQCIQLTRQRSKLYIKGDEY